MDATLVVIDSDAELTRARALVDELMSSDDASAEPPPRRPAKRPAA